MHSFVVVGVLANVGDCELGYMWLRVCAKEKALHAVTVKAGMRDS